jgi:hypothetical protein
MEFFFFCFILFLACKFCNSPIRDSNMTISRICKFIDYSFRRFNLSCKFMTETDALV